MQGASLVLVSLEVNRLLCVDGYQCTFDNWIVPWSVMEIWRYYVVATNVKFVVFDLRMVGLNANEFALWMFLNLRLLVRLRLVGARNHTCFVELQHSRRCSS